MSNNLKNQYTFGYSAEEERLNVISHAVGFIASIGGAYLLVSKTYQSGSTKYLLSVIVYCLSLMILFAASTLYHNAKEPVLRRKMKIVDHAAIFIMIAGSYTPFTLVTLEGRTGWSVFVAIWAFALIGVILKLFYTGRYEKLSTAMYVGMGWIAILVMKPLITALPTYGIYLLLGGGGLYTIGALFYSSKKIRFNHAIFHLFVLAGSLCHYLAIYFYV